MHLCVQPAEFGWQAADEDSLDGEIHADGSRSYSGQYAHGDTRDEALRALREIYEERLEFPDDLEERLEAAQAIAWIDERLADKDFKLAKAIVGAL